MFLPTSRREMDERGWDRLDVLIITGDAYVDSPAFGAALLGRWLEHHGYRVGIVAQPGWKDTADIARMGRPRLFAGITAGALDSMLAHYTAFRKKRSDDGGTPGGRAGARPNRATIVYSNLVRQAFPGLPLVIGGIEASMRRAVHYDFWSDALRRPMLLDAKADLLIYGMAETVLLEVAAKLAAGGGAGAGKLTDVRGTVFRRRAGWAPPGNAALRDLPDMDAMAAEPRLLMDATLAMERQVRDGAPWLAQRAGSEEIVIAPPAAPLETADLDRLYSLPFRREAHPSCRAPVPAEEMTRFSVVTHRGCAGGCSFCSIALHQGRGILSRSRESVLNEVARLAGHPRWTGSLNDVGGPSANMWRSVCARGEHPCTRTSCLTPRPCPFFKPGQKEVAALLDAISRVPGVKNVRVASGIRHDLAMMEPDYVEALVSRHVGGQLKLAPEHVSDRVLALMRKPGAGSFGDFLDVFSTISRRAGKEQYVVPYLMSAFPGCTDNDMRELAAWLRERGWHPQQVQCFVPTPGTVATAMYHAGIAPDGTRIHVAKTDSERMRQHRILTGGWGRPDGGQSPRRGGELERRGRTQGPARGRAGRDRRQG